MSKYNYYVYEYCSGRLVCLDLVREVFISDFVNVHNLQTFQYEFKGNKFETLEEFLSYLRLLNAAATANYENDFGIKPPYTVRQELRDSELCAYIEFKGLTLGFVPSLIPNWHLNKPIDKFFEETKGQLFDIEYMIKLHNFLINSMVIRPLHESRNYQFMITYADGKTTTAVIWRNVYENRCFLCACFMDNDEIFDSYSIPKSEILEIVKDAGFEWHGKWPETDMQTVYKVINYINRNCYASRPSVDGNFVVLDSGISYCGIIFKIKQRRSGKWYIYGDITKIISMFKMPDIRELRKFIDKTLGKKFRKGVFPECDSKEEIIKLLNEITKCPT
jgi:hypothetical protein